MKDKRIKKVSFIHLFVLSFLTIGTRTVIERNFSIIDSLDLHGINYLITDFIYFSAIASLYLYIYFLWLKRQRLPDSD